MHIKIRKRHYYLSTKLIILICFVIVLYLVFVITRYTNYTTYIPFSGKVFNIESEQLDYVRLVGSTSDVYERVFVLDYEKEEITEILNSFRYWIWTPGRPPGFSGYEYLIEFRLNDGTVLDFTFDDGWIEVRGIRYFGDTAGISFYLNG